MLTKQKETILELKKQLKSQELRHSKELRALKEAHTEVLKNFVQKHSAQVSGLESKIRSLSKILRSLVPEGGASGEKQEDAVSGEG